MFTEPVYGKDFFGRTDILNILNKRLDALKSGCRQNIALTGHILSGKSSIIYEFLDNLKDPSIIPVYIEVCEEPFWLFAGKFIATLLYNFLKSENISATKDIDDLIAKTEQIAPRTAEAVKKIRAGIAKRSYNKSYRNLLELTAILKKESRKSSVVILDEFHNLESFGIKNPYFYLGKIIMVQKDTMYVVSSSQRNKIRKILSEKLSLLFGNFEIVEVAGFDNKTAKSFLKGKLEPVNISEYYIDYLLNLTNKNPFYLDVIAKALKALADDLPASKIGMELVKDVFTELVYNPSGTISQHFTNNIHFLIDKNARRGYLDVLRALSEGAGKIKDISAYLKGRAKDISKKLDYLISIDLASRCGIFYKIEDRLFEFWLKNVYFKRQDGLIDDYQHRAGDFKNLVECDIEAYLIDYSRGIHERIRGLFQKFEGEIVEINKKLRKLPKFIRIEILKYGYDNNYIACEKSNKYWICQMKHEKVDESDIIDLIHKFEAKKDEIQKRILIPLNGIESNALLLAKEKRIWIWNPETVNNLLRLYRKHELII